MDAFEIKKIRKIAAEIRELIIKLSPEERPPALQDFPHGACGLTCLFLSKHLAENDLYSFDYVCGERNGLSHAWLRKDGIIIDITGDQFSDFGQGIFVGQKSNFHKEFKIIFEHSADVKIYDQGTRNDVEYFYRKIIGKGTDSI